MIGNPERDLKIPPRISFQDIPESEELTAIPDSSGHTIYGRREGNKIELRTSGDPRKGDSWVFEYTDRVLSGNYDERSIALWRPLNKYPSEVLFKDCISFFGGKEEIDCVMYSWSSSSSKHELFGKRMQDGLTDSQAAGRIPVGHALRELGYSEVSAEYKFNNRGDTRMVATYRKPLVVQPGMNSTDTDVA